MRRRLLFTGKALLGTLVPSDYKVGNLVLYDRIEDKKIVVDINNPTDRFPIDRYNPLAVIVIPSSHDVYGTGEAGAMSLVEMNIDNTLTGGIGTSLLAGNYINVDTLHKFKDVPHIGTLNDLKDSLQGIITDSNNGFLPSDMFFTDGTICPHNANFKYKYSSIDWVGVPSPYLTDGSRNPMYYQTTTPSSEDNCLANFNGRGDTDKILTYRGIKDYQTWVPNNSTPTDFPGVSLCDMFHPDGTSQGDWYLPSCGELGYVLSYYSKINNILSLIKENNTWSYTYAVQFSNTAYYMTSSLRSDGGGWYIDSVNGRLATDSSRGNIRAFIRISPPSDLCNTVLYDKTTQELFQTPNPTLFSPNNYEPIGIVVIPTNHNVYGTGECGVIAMHRDSLAWQLTPSLVLDRQFNTVVHVGQVPAVNASVQGVTSAVDFPSDKWSNPSGNTVCPHDTNSGYDDYISSSYYVAPSPYLTDGSRNPMYYQITEPSSDKNALAYFNGKENTVTESGADCSAAVYCSSFNTSGTKKGSWYLPSLAELGYLIARYQAVKNTIEGIIVWYTTSTSSKEIVNLGETSYYWSSTEASLQSALSIGITNGMMYNSTKTDKAVALPFTRGKFEVRLKP